MDWIPVETSYPPKSGKYVVKTKTSMGNSNTFETTFHTDGKKVKSFSVSNQIVTHWLK